MHHALRHVTHRPWPLPAGGWTWRQSWLDLAFIHYRVPAEQLRARLPAGVRVQEFDGSAWVGLVPFRMAGVMRGALPAMPYFSTFPELNVRTYVEVGGKPGVWFFSLDAQSWPIVMGGRQLFGLPYHYAEMRLGRSGDGNRESDGDGDASGWFAFSSVRRGGGARFKARYRPVGGVYLTEQGTFDHWATERYCLYSLAPRARGGVVRVEVHHVPWPLQRAEVEVERSDMLSAVGIDPSGEPPVGHFSAGVDAVSFAGERVEAGQQKVGSLGQDLQPF